MPRVGVQAWIPRVQEALDSSDLEWMAGVIKGAAPNSEAHIFVWPYAHDSVEDLADTFTHEAVHIADLDLSEGATRAVTAALMKSPRWRLIVFHRVADEMFKALLALKKKSGVEVA